MCGAYGPCHTPLSFANSLQPKQPEQFRFPNSKRVSLRLEPLRHGMTVRAIHATIMPGIATIAGPVCGIHVADLADAGGRGVAVYVSTAWLFGIKEFNGLSAFSRRGNAFFDHLAVDQAERYSCLAWINAALDGDRCPGGADDLIGVGGVRSIHNQDESSWR